jgi:hypothetical protein
MIAPTPPLKWPPLPAAAFPNRSEIRSKTEAQYETGAVNPIPTPIAVNLVCSIQEMKPDQIATYQAHGVDVDTNVFFPVAPPVPVDVDDLIVNMDTGELFVIKKVIDTGGLNLIWTAACKGQF